MTRGVMLFLALTSLISSSLMCPTARYASYMQLKLNWSKTELIIFHAKTEFLASPSSQSVTLGTSASSLSPCLYK